MTKPPGELEDAIFESAVEIGNRLNGGPIWRDDVVEIVSKRILPAVEREIAGAKGRVIVAAIAGYRYMESETEYRERLMALKGQTP